MLLDDVFFELDKNRRGLLKWVEGLVQTFVTTTGEEKFHLTTISQLKIFYKIEQDC